MLINHPSGRQRATPRNADFVPWTSKRVCFQIPTCSSLVPQGLPSNGASFKDLASLSRSFVRFNFLLRFESLSSLVPHFLLIIAQARTNIEYAFLSNQIQTRPDQARPDYFSMCVCPSVKDSAWAKSSISMWLEAPKEASWVCLSVIRLEFRSSSFHVGYRLLILDYVCCSAESRQSCCCCCCSPCYCWLFISQIRYMSSPSFPPLSLSLSLSPCTNIVSVADQLISRDSSSIISRFYLDPSNQTKYIQVLSLVKEYSLMGNIL